MTGLELSTLRAAARSEHMKGRLTAALQRPARGLTRARIAGQRFIRSRVVNWMLFEDGSMLLYFGGALNVSVSVLGLCDRVSAVVFADESGLVEAGRHDIGH